MMAMLGGGFIPYWGVPYFQGIEERRRTTVIDHLLLNYIHNGNKLKLNSRQTLRGSCFGAGFCFYFW